MPDRRRRRKCQPPTPGLELTPSTRDGIHRQTRRGYVHSRQPRNCCRWARAGADEVPRGGGLVAALLVNAEVDADLCSATRLRDAGDQDPGCSNIVVTVARCRRAPRAHGSGQRSDEQRRAAQHALIDIGALQASAVQRGLDCAPTRWLQNVKTTAGNAAADAVSVSNLGRIDALPGRFADAPVWFSPPSHMSARRLDRRGDRR